MSFWDGLEFHEIFCFLISRIRCLFSVWLGYLVHEFFSLWGFFPRPFCRAVNLYRAFILCFCYCQINQKMMKSTLIKDLYGEIERLKAGEIVWMFLVGELVYLQAITCAM